MEHHCADPVCRFGFSEHHTPLCRHARTKQRPPLGDWFIWVISTGRGWGKMLALDTPIPTPIGWSKMGDLTVGDQVFDENGQPCQVIEVYDGFADKTYTLEFSDGSSVTACSEHLWVTLQRREKIQAGWAAKTPITTEVLVCSLRGEGRDDLQHRVPTAGPLVLPEVPLPVDPYVLGIWLGDGGKNGGGMTAHVDDAPHYKQRCEDVGESFEFVGYQKEHVGSYLIGRRPVQRDPVTQRFVSDGSLRQRLKQLGVLGNKHVPAIYLRASAGQRLALLQGLIDTDGSVGNGRVDFGNTNKAIAEAVVELARSLGQKPRLMIGTAKLNGRVTGPSYRVKWRATLPVASLPRKATRLQLHEKGQWGRNLQRMVVSAQPALPQPMRCITVDSPNRMYLAGEAMVPTHNTLTGAQWVKRKAKANPGVFYAVIAPTHRMLYRNCVDGPSGLRHVLGVQDRDYVLNRSSNEIRLPNGTVIYLESAQEPDRIRGANLSGAWCDEVGSWTYAATWYEALVPAVRIEPKPQILVTTTPKPTVIMRDLLKRTDGSVVVTYGSQRENRINLSERAIREFELRYKGTRLGRQELEGELLEEAQGALWKHEWIDSTRLWGHTVHPDGSTTKWTIDGLYEKIQPVRVVIGVDPAGTNDPESDETGIIVAAKGKDGHGYVLADLSGQYDVEQWPQVVIAAAGRWGVDRVVAEVNFGADYIGSTLRAAGYRGGYEPVRATRGKAVRAEPAAIAYQQGNVHHVNDFEILEAQMCEWVPGITSDSPDRLDACVWALSWLGVAVQSTWADAYPKPERNEYRPFEDGKQEETPQLNQEVKRGGWGKVYRKPGPGAGQEGFNAFVP